MNQRARYLQQLTLKLEKVWSFDKKEGGAHSKESQLAPKHHPLKLHLFCQHYTNFCQLSSLTTLPINFLQNSDLFNPKERGGGQMVPPGLKYIISLEPNVGLMSNQAVKDVFRLNTTVTTFLTILYPKKDFHHFKQIC